MKAINMVTRGQRKLGRIIRKLENSVELSNKESMAKESERKYLEEVRKLSGYSDDYPVQSLCNPFLQKKYPKDP
jgi:hypothetical protein